jgi:hypothetical protein
MRRHGSGSGRIGLSIASILSLVATACAGPSVSGSKSPSRGADAQPLPQGSQAFELDATDFLAQIDHPYWPMTPGSRWTYREVGAAGSTQIVEVSVTDETKTILGIEATVVHDVVTHAGHPIEDTKDWYAQDAWGNLWYLGEDTKEFENGEVISTAGSWEAGVDGAQAGVILPGSPAVGMAYRQEYYEGQAEDAAEILSLEEQADVPFGSFDHVLMTRDYTPLEPNLVEHKFYAQGIGPVLSVTVSGGAGREELVEFSPGG